MTGFDPVNRMQRSAKTASGFGLMIFVIAIIVTGFLQTSCTSENTTKLETTNILVIDELKTVKIIQGTSKMNSCPRDMFVDDTGVEDTDLKRACIIFPNNEIAANNHDYTPDYLKQLEESTWSKPKKIANNFLFTDTTDERSIQERAKCQKLLSLVIWYDGEAEVVDAAIKTATTDQFKNKILAFSLIGNDCN